MERIVADVVAEFGSLLDERESVEFAVPAVYDPRGMERPPRRAGLLVTDMRIVVGAVDLDRPGSATLIALRDRRLRLQPKEVDGSIRTEPLLDLHLDLQWLELLDTVDAGAASWDRVDAGVLGVLEVDEYGTYRMASDADLPDVRVTLDGDIPADVLEFAERCAVDHPQISDEALDAVVAAMFEMKNDNWLSDGEAPLSEAEFRARLTAKSFAVLGSEIVDLFYDDGGMFGGHSVVATHFGGERARWDVDLFG